MGKYQQECDYLGIIHSQSVTIDELRAEIAALKSVSLEPICFVDAGHLREVSNGNNMLIYASSEQDEQGRLEPLYLAEQINKMREGL